MNKRLRTCQSDWNRVLNRTENWPIIRRSWVLGILSRLRLDLCGLSRSLQIVLGLRELSPLRLGGRPGNDSAPQNSETGRTSAPQDSGSDRTGALRSAARPRAALLHSVLRSCRSLRPAPLRSCRFLRSAPLRRYPPAHPGSVPFQLPPTGQSAKIWPIRKDPGSAWPICPEPYNPSISD